MTDDDFRELAVEVATIKADLGNLKKEFEQFLTARQWNVAQVLQILLILATLATLWAKR